MSNSVLFAPQPGHVLVTAVMLAAALAGCSSHAVASFSPAASPTLRIPSTALPSSTKEATASPFPPTETPPPTLSVQVAQAEVQALLETNGDCDLPCFWGLSPGASRPDDAIRLFTHLGWSGIAFQGDTASFYDTGYEIPGRLSISPIVILADDTIAGVFVAISGPSYAEFITVANSPFSLEAILKRHGTPSRVGVDLSTQGEIGYPRFTGFELYLLYDTLGTIVQYSGIAARIGQYYRVCPLRPANGGLEGKEGPASVILHLQPPDSPAAIEDLRAAVGGVRVAPRNDSLRAFGLTPEQFAQLYVSGKGPCLESPLSIW
jgi:hypothetical protein